MVKDSLNDLDSGFNYISVLQFVLCGNVRILEAFDQIIAKLSDLYSGLGAVLLGQHGQASFESDAERSIP
jgi:hypothetical protein